MKLEKTKNATRNIASGILMKIFDIVIPFILRTVMIYSLGVQYLGLNSLCTSILSFLNLAELGVGGAMVFSMYKPIAEDDSKTICALMRLYRLLYRIIGTVVLVLGLIMGLFLDKLIKGDIPPDINIHIVYYMNLALTVLSYWLFAYKNSLLTAHQREDVNTNVTLGVNVVQYAFQVVALLVFKNYYLYLGISLFCIVIKNIVCAVCVTKMYPDYYCEGDVSKELKRDIFSRVKDLFTAKLGGVVISSADTVVISAYLGLVPLAIYNNYYLIITSLVGFMNILYNAVRAGIGNSIVIDTPEKVYKNFEMVNFIFQWIVSFITICLLCLYQPFIKIWLGKDLMFDDGIVVMLCVYFYLWKSSDILNTYKDAAGIWHADRFRPLMSSIANLMINIALVQKFGMYGILTGTILCYLLISIPWLVSNCFSNLFKRSAIEYIVKYMIYTGVTVLCGTATLFVCSLVKCADFPALIIKMGICCIVPNFLQMAIYCRMDVYKSSKKKVLDIFSRFHLKNK